MDRAAARGEPRSRLDRIRAFCPETTHDWTDGGRIRGAGRPTSGPAWSDVRFSPRTRSTPDPGQKLQDRVLGCAANIMSVRAARPPLDVPRVPEGARIVFRRWGAGD